MYEPFCLMIPKMRLLVATASVFDGRGSAWLCSVLYCIPECFLRGLVLDILVQLLKYSAGLGYPLHQSVSSESHWGEQVRGCHSSMCWGIRWWELIQPVRQDVSNKVTVCNGSKPHTFWSFDWTPIIPYPTMAAPCWRRKSVWAGCSLDTTNHQARPVYRGSTRYAWHRSSYAS